MDIEHTVHCSGGKRQPTWVLNHLLVLDVSGDVVVFLFRYHLLLMFTLTLFLPPILSSTWCCSTSEAVKELRSDGAENLNISKHRKILGNILNIFSFT